MNGRAFLEVARHDVAERSEAYWRAAAVHAYYGLMLECRETLLQWGAVLLPRQNVHSFVRLKLIYSTDADLKLLGHMLEKLVQLRNDAHYDLGPVPKFASDASARRAIQDAATAIQLLDAIHSDSARLRAAIAALPP